MAAYILFFTGNNGEAARGKSGAIFQSREHTKDQGSRLRALIQVCQQLNLETILAEPVPLGNPAHRICHGSRIGIGGFMTDSRDAALFPQEYKRVY